MAERLVSLFGLILVALGMTGWFRLIPGISDNTPTTICELLLIVCGCFTAWLGFVVIPREIGNNDINDLDDGVVQDAEIVAYRIWRVEHHAESKPALHSWVMTRTIWPYAQELVSRKDRGIHAFKTLSHLLEYAGSIDKHSPHAIGTVSLWGQVIEFERGYTAEYAYPRKLICSDEKTAADLRRAYGCEAYATTDARTLEALCTV
jgi:hypothetical protein